MKIFFKMRERKFNIFENLRNIYTYPLNNEIINKKHLIRIAFSFKERGY